jgi:hypothetical protein
MVDPTTDEREAADGLERLLEVEARIDERLAECRAQADEILRATREELAASDARLDAELRAERQRRLAAREAEFRREIRHERDEAARTARRLRAIPAARIEALAREVIGRLVDGPASPRTATAGDAGGAPETAE